MSRSSSPSPFHFRDFSLRHHRSSMPVGTDAVLLGAWAEPGDARSILDIGCGCGIIALMMAQRSKARITGIDVHLPSVEEARSNAEASPWKGRLEFRHAALRDLPDEGVSYDLILSNPPYFTDDLRPGDPRRQLARHSSGLNPSTLITQGIRLLGPEGRIAMVIPAQVFPRILPLPPGWALRRKTTVVPREGKPARLLLLEIGRDALRPTVESTLLLRHADGSVTRGYRDLTADFYLSLV